MSGLESDYPDVRFVYMTGHTDGSGLEGNLHIRNQQIRNYCAANDKILYDFEDIESYDPDGSYFGDKYVTDSCEYDGGNWAIEWQDSHQEGVDWYDCSSAHSQPLNANRKAYAAWWLWARLAGWEVLLLLGIGLSRHGDGHNHQKQDERSDGDSYGCHVPVSWHRSKAFRTRGRLAARSLPRGPRGRRRPLYPNGEGAQGDSRHGCLGLHSRAAGR
jgi:hypothetical protein